LLSKVAFKFNLRPYSWTLCYLCIMRGAESAGKAIWITMPLPYLLLLILLIKGATLPAGAYTRPLISST
jgi:hypothetical protein